MLQKYILSPNGKSEKNTDKIMLLAMWANKLTEEGKNIIRAGMGRPTFPISKHIALVGVVYWYKLFLKSQNINARLLSGETLNNIIEDESVDAFKDLQGKLECRQQMANALNCWYQTDIIAPENILFTVGGAGALHNIFEVLEEKEPGGIILTPFPHYTLYTGPKRKNKLYPIPVMEQKGYQLTAELLSGTLEKAQKQAEEVRTKVSAFLLCEPNNPLGTSLSEEELLKIAQILKDNPDIVIILDEAYVEMRFNGKRYSLLSVAPGLKDRIILMRSATKGLSAAGERMAVIYTGSDELMTKLVAQNINICGHASVSLQSIFASAMEELAKSNTEGLINFYKNQVEYVDEYLRKIGANMPDDTYTPNGAFYIMADLSDLIGLELPPETERVLGESKTGKIETDEEIIYYLLFKQNIMIAPLSYFGMPKEEGYVRITCSGGKEELGLLMESLETELLAARKSQFEKNHEEYLSLLQELGSEPVPKEVRTKIFLKIATLQQELKHTDRFGAAEYKKINVLLKDTISGIKNLLIEETQKILNSVTKIQSYFRKYDAEKGKFTVVANINRKRKKLLNLFSETVCYGEMQPLLRELSPAKLRQMINKMKLFAAADKDGSEEDKRDSNDYSDDIGVSTSPKITLTSGPSSSGVKFIATY